MTTMSLHLLRICKGSKEAYGTEKAFGSIYSLKELDELGMLLVGFVLVMVAIVILNFFNE
jgi:hypothetical protein